MEDNGWRTITFVFLGFPKGHGLGFREYLSVESNLRLDPLSPDSQKELSRSVKDVSSLHFLLRTCAALVDFRLSWLI